MLVLKNQANIQLDYSRAYSLELQRLNACLSGRRLFMSNKFYGFLPDLEISGLDAHSLHSINKA
jgi:hypothetical protein